MTRGLRRCDPPAALRAWQHVLPRAMQVPGVASALPPTWDNVPLNTLGDRESAGLEAAGKRRGAPWSPGVPQPPVPAQ